jgi:hypothetical protein
MKQLLKHIYLFLVLVYLTSCAGSIHTFSNKYSKGNLKNYKSYAWLAPGDSIFNRDRPEKVFGEYILKTANTELKQKGMVLDTLRPDAIFVFETYVETKVEYTQSPTVSVGIGYGGPGYYVGGSAPISGGEVYSSEYDEGSLIVDMFDTQTGELLWRGGAKSTISVVTDTEQTIKTALHHIFIRLPIKHKN